MIVTEGCICISWVVPDTFTAKSITMQSLEFIELIGIISLHIGDEEVYNIPGDGCEVLEAAMIQAIKLENKEAIEVLLSFGNCNLNIVTDGTGINYNEHFEHHQ